MDRYLLALYVTVEQELAIRDLFSSKGWDFTDSSDTGDPVSKMKLTRTKQRRPLSSLQQCKDQESSSSELHTVETESFNTDVKTELSEQEDDIFEASKETIDSGLVEEDSDDTVDLEINEHVVSYDNIRDYQSLESSEMKYRIIKKEIHAEDYEKEIDSDNYDNSTSDFKGSDSATIPVKVKMQRSFTAMDEGDCNTMSHTAECSSAGKGKLIDQSKNCLQSKLKMSLDRINCWNNKSSKVIKVVEESSKTSQSGYNVDMFKDKKNLKTKVSKNRDQKTNTELARKRESRKGAFYCEECQTTFKVLGYLEKHKRDGKCMFTCEYCGKIYNVKRYAVYKAHVRCHLNDRPYKCNSCEKTYTTERHLRDHTRKHLNIRPYICQTCGLQFHISAALIAHTKRVHSTEEKKSYKCDICGLTVAALGTLKSHKMFVHTDVKPFTCEVCGKSFKIPRHLKRHSLVHIEDFPYVCSFASCGQKFKRNEALAIHVRRVHSNIKRHFCDQCGKGFYGSVDLKKHIRTHTGEKPFSCTLCDYKCALQSSLIIHRKTHKKHANLHLQ